MKRFYSKFLNVEPRTSNTPVTGVVDSPAEVAAGVATVAMGVPFRKTRVAGGWATVRRPAAPQPEVDFPEEAAGEAARVVAQACVFHRA